MRTPSSSGTSREYPEHPRVGVGTVVLDGDQVLLVKRGRHPALGKWSIPGGLVDLGEATAEAAQREVLEECGIRVRLTGVAGVVDRVIRDAEGRVRYHYVLVDYAGCPESRAICAGTDAAEVRWVPIADLERYDTTEGLLDMIQRARALCQGGHG
jgi:8-oxo-dGTP diphosphatase